MSPTNLLTATLHTKNQIDYLKQQIEEASDPKEKRRLQHHLKELQYLQLWRLDQLEATNEDPL